MDDDKRFIVLKQKRITIGAQFAVAGANPAQNDSVMQSAHNAYFNFNIKLNKKTLYSVAGNAGTVADINKGALWIVFSSFVTDGVAADTHAIYYQTRLMYEDA